MFNSSKHVGFVTHKDDNEIQIKEHNNAMSITYLSLALLHSLILELSNRIYPFR